MNRYTGEYFALIKYYPCDWSIGSERVTHFNEWQKEQADSLEQRLGKANFNGGDGTYFLWCDEQDDRVELYDFENRKIILREPY